MIIFIAVPYLAIALLLAFFQRSMIYGPVHDTSLNVRPPGILGARVEPISLLTADRLLNGTGREAFNAMKGLFPGPNGEFDVHAAADPERARRILFDDAYYGAKASITAFNPVEGTPRNT